MEKLIELLNEWERERVNHNTKEYIKRGKNSFTRLWIIEVISKSYWFIKWSDKQTLKDVYIAWAKQYELIIMLLAISDTPIDDLISYLR